MSFDRLKKFGGFLKNNKRLTIAWTIVSIEIIGLLGLLVFLKVKDNEHENNINKVQHNIENNTEFEDYILKAYRADYIEGDYLLRIYGEANKRGDNNTELLSVSYNIDKDLYDKIRKNVEVYYQFDAYENIINVEMKGRGSIKNLDIMKELAEITENEPVSVTIYNSNSSSRSNSSSTDYDIEK